MTAKHENSKDPFKTVFNSREEAQKCLLETIDKRISRHNGSGTISVRIKELGNGKFKVVDESKG